MRILSVTYAATLVRPLGCSRHRSTQAAARVDMNHSFNEMQFHWMNIDFYWIYTILLPSNAVTIPVTHLSLNLSRWLMAWCHWRTVMNPAPDRRQFGSGVWKRWTQRNQ